jgi:multimeric flavodoxin WrbA
MKKITAFVGTSRKGHTYQATAEFAEQLRAGADVEVEIVRLGEYDIKTCRGCKVCFERGEESCPLSDDWSDLFAKVLESDGIVFASPNYSFQVSGLMKVFLDRFGWVFHRPNLHGKTFTSIVVQGIYGGKKIVKYLDFVGKGLGCDVVKGSCATAFEPMTAKEQAKRDRALAKQAQRFARQLAEPAGAAPGLFELLIFRYARTSMWHELDETNRDWQYYEQQGWFESDYYYETELGVGKRVLGRALDAVFARVAQGRAG